MSGYPPDRESSNGRVSNAILSTKLDMLTAKVEKLCDQMERRLSFLEEKTEIRCGEIESQTRQNAKDIAVMHERIKTSTGVLGALQAIAFGVSTFLGTKF